MKSCKATKKVVAPLIMLLLFSALFAFSGTAVHATTVYTITASSDANSVISPGTEQLTGGYSSVVDVDSGGSQTFTFSANSGYYIYNVIVDNSYVSTTSTTYTFSDVQSDHTIQVFSYPLSGSSIAMQNSYPNDVDYTSVDYLLYQMTPTNTNETMTVSIDGATPVPTTFEGAINELVTGDTQNRIWFTWDATVTPITASGTHTFQFNSSYLVWSPQTNPADSYWASMTY